MAAEEILNLFDSHWFENGILISKPCLASFTTKPIHDQEDHELERSRFSSMANLQIRSLSDRCLCHDTGSSSGAASPKSVITAPSLQKILSGVEMSEFSKRIEEQEMIKAKTKKRVGNRRKRRRRWGSKGLSRSISELEYELKGLMDLGFVFTEEEKASSLVSIIPGLQRWGKRDSNERVDEKYTVSRPYLSEAWDVLNHRKVNEPLVNWRFPDTYNEINMKENLKAWAHTVASTIR